MSSRRNQRSAAILLAASLGLLPVAEAQAGPREALQRPAASIAIRIQQLSRTLIGGAQGMLAAFAGDNSPGQSPGNPPNDKDGAGLDPHGGGNGNGNGNKPKP